MALNAKNAPGGGAPRKRQPPLVAGSYPARLVQVIDLGLQKQRPFKGEEKPPANMLYTTYELLDEFVVNDEGEEQEDKPRWVSEDFPFYSLDSDKAKSTKRYFALDPSVEKGGAWDQLVGDPCIVTLTADKDKKGKTDDKGDPIIYNNIANTAPMRDKDAKKAEGLKNDPKILDLENPDLEVFLALPDWLRDRIKEGLEFEGSPLAKMLSKIDEADEVKNRRESRSKGSDSAKESSKESDQVDDSGDDDGDDGDDW